MCYIEFGDEEAMKAGLAKQGEVRLSSLPGPSPPATSDADPLLFRRN